MQRLIAFLIICLMCISCFASCESIDSTSQNSDDRSNAPSSYDEELEIDLSSFQGNPDIEMLVDIERDAQSSFFECVAMIKNNTQKNIAKMRLYLVKCRDGKAPLESSLYAEKLLIENFNNEKPDIYRWVLGNSSGQIVFKAYLAYIEYEDGTTWGLEKVDHKTVVTRNFELDVCEYNASTPTTKQQFHVSYSARVVSNSHVGDNWYYGLEYNDVLVNPYTTITVDVAENRGARFKIYAIEDDSDNDYGSGIIRFPIMEIGETVTLTQQVVVVENGGRYSGHKAYVLFTVTITRVDEEA